MPTQKITKSDIRDESPVLRHCPEGLRPYVLLTRLDRPIGIWLLLLPGWCAIVMGAGGLKAMNLNDWRIFTLFAIGAIIMRAAGCVINDLWDRDLDRKVNRTRMRPLASGAISTKEAFVFLAALLFCGLLILIQFNLITILLGLLSLPLIAVYPLTKRWTWWPQAFLGLVFNFGALMGWSAATGIVELPALALYGAGFLWTLGYDTIYAHQDKEDDALVGVRSTALRFGDQSFKWVSGFYTGAGLMLLLAFTAAYKSDFSAFHLVWAVGYGLFLLRKWQPDNTESCLETFKANRDVGLLVLFAAFVAGL